MFFTIYDFVGMGACILFLLIWLILYILGNRYHEMFDMLPEKEFPFKELYGMGYAFMELTHYQYKSKWDRKNRSSLMILYTEKYAEYYLRVVYAQIVTIGSLLLVIGLGITVLSGYVFMLVMVAVYEFAAVYYFMTLPQITIEKRSDELINDYAEVVSNLALLTNAGMILRDAWEEAAFSNDGIFYQEMQKVVVDLNNGVGESQAFREFGIRCVIPEAKKLASTIIQGIQKGNRELAKSLQEQSAEVWEQRKQLVKRRGEKAANKLMIPIYLMFIGILIMIIVPIFANVF